ncbi:MAG: hotdog domain-containing protein [Bacteroidota bacterium]
MESKKTGPVEAVSLRLIKSEDLNHHGTLFAGRTAEWFVEAGFVAAANLINPKNVVCLQIHGMYFSAPAHPGEVLKFVSKIILTGRSSLMAHVTVTKMNEDKVLVSGFVTYIHVDENTRPIPHNIEIVPVTEEDIRLYEEALRVKNQRN